MKEKKIQDFPARLQQAERFGMMAVRETCREEIKNCGSDGEKLARLANMLGELSDDALEANDREKAGVYDVIIQEITTAAKDLNRTEYHRFCENIHVRTWLQYR